MIKYLKLLRVEQWVKNFFVFIPLFFSGNVTHPQFLIKSIFAFVAFSLIASSIYILNDYETNKEYIGISGIGIVEMGSHQQSKSTIMDER